MSSCWDQSELGEEIGMLIATKPQKPVSKVVGTWDGVASGRVASSLVAVRRSYGLVWLPAAWRHRTCWLRILQYSRELCEMSGSHQLASPTVFSGQLAGLIGI